MKFNVIIIIEYNLFVNNKARQIILVEGSQHYIFKSNVVTRNIATNYKDWGSNIIDLISSDNGMLINNTIECNTATSENLNGTESRILSVKGSDNIHVANNDFISNHIAGNLGDTYWGIIMQFQGGKNQTSDSNTFANNSGRVIYWNSWNDNSTLKYTSFINNTAVEVFDWGCNIILSQGCDDCIVRNNLFKYNTLKRWSRWSSTSFYYSWNQSNLYLGYNQFIDNYIDFDDPQSSFAIAYIDVGSNQVYEFNVFGNVIDITGNNKKLSNCFYFWRAMGAINIQYNDFNINAMDKSDLYNTKRRLTADPSKLLILEYFGISHSNTSISIPVVFDIRYNNFWEAEYVANVAYLDSWRFNVSLSNNYFSGIDRLYNISERIYDRCWNTQSQDGYVTFWPIYKYPIDLTNPGNITTPTECDWGGLTQLCSYTDTSLLVPCTQAPTDSPTTLDPTSASPATATTGTNQPTRMPTDITSPPTVVTAAPSDQTISPSSSPTPSPVVTVFIVTINTILNYAPDNNTAIKIGTIYKSIVTKVLNNTLEMDCIMNYTQSSIVQNSMTFLNSTILVCDKQAQMDLINALNQTDFKTQLLDAINDETGEQLIASDIISSKIKGDIIIITTTTSSPSINPSSTVNEEINNNPEDTGVFLSWTIIYILIAALVCIACGLLIILVYCRKSKSKTKSTITSDRRDTRGGETTIDGTHTIGSSKTQPQTLTLPAVNGPNHFTKINSYDSDQSPGNQPGAGTVTTFAYPTVHGKETQVEENDKDNTDTGENDEMFGVVTYNGITDDGMTPGNAHASIQHQGENHSAAIRRQVSDNEDMYADHGKSGITPMDGNTPQYTAGKGQEMEMVNYADNNMPPPVPQHIRQQYHQ